MDKKTNFEFQLKVKIKKIPDSDNQIIVHVLKQSLKNFMETITNYIENSVLQTADIKKELAKQLDLKQLERVEIEPEILETIRQADVVASFQEPVVPEQGIAGPPESRPVAPPGIETPAYTPSPAAQPRYSQQPPPVPGSEPSSLTAPKITIPDFSAPSTVPSAPPVPDISFSIPRVSLKTEPEPSTASPSIVDEEDRATGIAILRKKMLMELKKIRSVVSEEEEF